MLPGLSKIIWLLNSVLYSDLQPSLKFCKWSNYGQRLAYVDMNMIKKKYKKFYLISINKKCEWGYCLSTNYNFALLFVKIWDF